MKLLLSSDGKTAVENISKVWNNIDTPKVAWVITALKASRNVNYADLTLQTFLQQESDFHLYDINNKTKKDFNRELSSFDIILVEGGTPFSLLKSFRESGFDAFIKNWVKEKPYIGISSGCYMVCPTIEMSFWKKPNRDTFGLIDYAGLNLIDFLITCHYKDEYMAKIKEGINRSNFPTKILRDGQALVVENGNVELIGEGDLVTLK